MSQTYRYEGKLKLLFEGKNELVLENFIRANNIISADEINKYANAVDCIKDQFDTYLVVDNRIFYQYVEKVKYEELDKSVIIKNKDNNKSIIIKCYKNIILKLRECFPTIKGQKNKNYYLFFLKKIIFFGCP